MKSVPPMDGAVGPVHFAAVSPGYRHSRGKLREHGRVRSGPISGRAWKQLPMEICLSETSDKGLAGLTTARCL